MRPIVDAERLRAESLEIEEMLGDLRERLAPETWAEVEGVLARLVRLYGVGLQRALEHARASGAAGPGFDEALAGDDLLADLLVMHGLHPLSTTQRVERLARTLTRRLGVPAESLVLVWLGDDRVRVLSALGEEVDPVLRRALENVAPELESVDIVAFSDAPRAS
jgi:hypothetical protein